MTDVEAEGVPPVQERVVAIFSDPRAAVLLLKSSLKRLLRSQAVSSVLIDVSTPAGVVARDAAISLELPYRTLDFGQQNARNGDADDVPVFPIDLGRLGAVDANIVLIPAAVPEAARAQIIDFSPQTVVGQVLSQAEAVGHGLLVVEPPERGLLPQDDEPGYLRRIIHVAAAPAPEAADATEAPTEQ